VSLSFHKNTNKLHCHYRELFTRLLTVILPGGRPLDQRNFGTERIEEQLRKYFPKARIEDGYR
jgi:primosomal protein N' (replication factor Y)